MIATSSSSSTLSPLAPPFTVDRPNSSHRLHPYRYPHRSVAEFNGNGSFDGEESAPVRSTGESSSWIDPSLPYNAPAFSRGGASESFIAYADAYGAWHGKHFDSSARPVHIGADSSAWRDDRPAIYEEKAGDSCNNLSYFQLPNPNIAMDECHTSNSNSSYDRYMSQLVSCSTDPIVYYPATTYSSSAEEFTPAKEASSSMYFAPRNCYSTTQHGNLLHNVDDNYVDYMLGNKKEPVINQYSDGKEAHANESIADSNVRGNNRTGNFTCSSLGNEETTGNSMMDYSAEEKYGFGTKQLNFTESIASSSRPNSCLQTSSEILDQPNFAVDSPCWKGASMSQQYSFGGGEMIDRRYEVKESKSFDELNELQERPLVSGQYLRTSPCQEKDGGLVCHGNTRSSLPFLGNFSPNISPHATDKRFHDVNAKGSECAQIGEENRSHISYAIIEKSNAVKDSEKDFELLNRNVKQLGQVRIVIPSTDSPALEEGAHAETGLTDASQDKSSALNLDSENHVRNFSLPGVVLGQVASAVDSTDTIGKCLTAGKEMRLLVEAMHGLSEVLLSSSYNVVVEWKECDHELVQLVIDNLETFRSRNRKGIPKCSSHFPGNGQGQSQVSVSKSNDTVKKQSNTSSEDAVGKFCCIGSCLNNDKFDGRRFNGIAQVTVKDLVSDAVAKKEENPLAVLYKNLWTQAEAGLCSMKYELQLAHMKLEMEEYECQTKAKEPVQVMKSPTLNSMQGSDMAVFTTPQSLCDDASYLVGNDAGKISEAKPKEQKTNKDDRVEASVMARLEVLKSRYARSKDISIEEQPKCSDTENTLKELPTRLADLGFVESGMPQTFDEDGYRDAYPSVLKGKHADRQHLVPNYNEENYALYREISEHAFGGGSPSCIADGPFLQPFLPSTGSQRNPMRFILG